MAATKRNKDDIRDKLLSKLEKIIDDPEMSMKDVLKAIELIGKEFGLFAEQRNVKIDVNTVVRNFTDQQLRSITGQGGDSVDYIDVLPGVPLLADTDNPGTG
jgi:hypothetical protein